MKSFEQGQLTVEFALCLTVWMALAAGAMALSQEILGRQRAHAAVRLGTLLMGTGRVESSVAADEMRAYLRRVPGVAGGGGEIEMGRFLETPAAKFYHLFQVTLATDKWRETVVVEQEQRAQ